MMMRSKLLTLAFVSVLFGLVSTAQAQAPTSAGTWVLDTAASKTTNPMGMPKSGERTYTFEGKAEKMSATVVAADGKEYKEGFSGMEPDGKERPFQSTVLGDGVTIAAKPGSSPNTVDFVLKKDGKDVITGTRTLATDGKSMTIASKGTTADGKPFEASMVWNKK
jgi:hypothetical protein